MKKSRIIIPALALIALSTVASVTGTVAWFTASRQVTVTAGQFQITKASSSLDITLTEAAYTLVNNTSNVVTIDSNAILTHGSFNHTNSKFYRPDSTAKTLTEVAYDDETNLVQSTTSGGDKIVTGVSWKMALKVSFAEAGRDMALFFNEPASEVKVASDDSDPTATGKAFRIAFVADSVTVTGAASTTSTSTTKVWAPHQASGKCTYITGPGTTMTGSSYASGVLIDEDGTDPLPADEVATASECQSHLGYLGTYKFAANATITMNFIVAAWFEGTDENIDASSTVMETLKSTMKFDVRTIADTPANNG